MSLCAPFWINPVGISLCFLDLDVCLLSQVREVFSSYIFKYVYRPFLSLFSFRDPIMWILVCLMLSQRSLNCPQFFSLSLIIFFFSVQGQLIPLFCLPAYWSLPLYYSVYYWVLLVHFLFQLFYCQSLINCSLNFLTLCLKCMLCAYILLPFCGNVYDHYL